jgi:hypothetical protein
MKFVFTQNQDRSRVWEGISEQKTKAITGAVLSSVPTATQCVHRQSEQFE